MYSGVARINISIEKINNLLSFVPEAILYVHIRDSTQGGGEIVFCMSCLLFGKSKLYKGNPPSHSLECNVVFIICQGYYYKNAQKKEEVAPRSFSTHSKQSFPHYTYTLPNYDEFVKSFL